MHGRGVVEGGHDGSVGNGDPDANHMIITGRRENATMGRPCDGVHLLSVITIDKDVLTGQGIPYMYPVVIVSRGDALAIGRPSQRIDRYGNAGSPFLYKS